MTTNLPNVPYSTQTAQGLNRQRQTRLRADADAMLRDMAFVLKMTQKVRDEIHSEQEQPEPACV